MRQVLFVVEGEKAEHNAVLACRRAFEIEPEDLSILTFGTHIHSLIKTIGAGQHGDSIDFEGIELRGILWPAYVRSICDIQAGCKRKTVQRKEGKVYGLEKISERGLCADYGVLCRKSLHISR